MRGAALTLALLLPGCTLLDEEPDRESLPLEGVTFDTDMGRIVVVLYADAAPATVAHLQTLVRGGYYDGREFGRTVPAHVIQVVDRLDGATDDPRRVPLETHAAYHFSAGAAGIARGADPASGGPELFFMDFATSHLDGAYTVWGQVVGGLDVVHRIARVASVPTGEVPLPLPVTDRTPVVAPRIVAATLGGVKLAPEAAAALPLVVATNQRAGDLRHSLEWPADVRPDAAADLTWYVRPYNGTALPAPETLQVLVDGARVAVEADAEAPGAYHWTWTPRRSGQHEATLLTRGEPLGTLRIHVA